MDKLGEKVVERAQEIELTYERLQETQKRLCRSEKLVGIGLWQQVLRMR